MIMIQIIVVVIAAALVVFGLGHRQTHAVRAWKKLALCLLAVSMVVAVLLPEWTNDLAHFFGVGRGADLLLYILTLAFIVFAINSYLHSQDQRDTVFRLARKIALLDARERYGLNTDDDK